MNSFIQTTLKNLPSKPGVYRFYDKYENLLYVGKAKNLKKRVVSYFQESKNHTTRIWLMVSLIDRIEYNIVKTEEESLILEANLIHELQPKYNVLLKDDKSFIYLRITLNDEIPGIFFTRKRYDPKSLYFGPYTKKVDLINILRTVRMIFPYCQKQTLQKKPCEYVAIHQCDGICVGLETRENYLKKIEQISNIFEGKTELVKTYLEQKIQDSINIENYELAGLYRDRLKILDATISNQKIVLNQPENLDIISLVVKEPEDTGLQVSGVNLLKIREGKIINVENFILSGSFEAEENDQKESGKQEIGYEFLNRFLSSYYSLNDEKITVYTQVFV